MYKYIGRKDTQEFFLCAMVQDITMLHSEAPYCLQISIGHIGDEELTLDNRELQYVSTEPRTNNKTEYVQTLASSAENGKFYYIPISNTKPILTLTGRFPRVRRYMYEVNMVQNLVVHPLKTGLYEVDHLGPGSEKSIDRLYKAFQDVCGGCEKYLKLSSIEEFEVKVRRLRDTVSLYLRETNVKFNALHENAQKLLGEYKLLLEMPLETLPDVTLWIFRRRKRVSFKRLPARHILHAKLSHSEGQQCGKIVTMLLKDVTNKYKGVAGRVDLWLWLGIYEDYQDCIQALRDYTGLHIISIPRQIILNKQETFQLIAHIYCAVLKSTTEKLRECEFSVRVIIYNQYLQTETSSSYGPNWNETLEFRAIDFFFPLSTIEKDPPTVLLEVYKKQRVRKQTFFGEAMAFAQIKHDISEPSVRCLKVYNGKENFGELWVVLVLLKPSLVAEIKEASEEDDQFRIYREIALHTYSYRLEVMFLIIDTLDSIKNKYVKKVVLHCAGKEIKSAVKKDLTFEKPYSKIDIVLPQSDEHHFPVELMLVDKNTNILGTHHINNIMSLSRNLIEIEDYESLIKTIVISWSHIDVYSSHELLQHEKLYPYEHQDEKYTDWWDKYMSKTSIITMYSEELERQLEFGGVSDVYNSFEFTHTSHHKHTQKSVCKLKGSLVLYQHPTEDKVTEVGQNTKHGLIDPQLYNSINVDVRVYIVRCWDLAPKDYSVSSDPFIVIKLGKRKLDNRDDYVPADLNPVIGHCFEILNVKLPLEHLMHVIVMDWNLTVSDNMIGETVIDLSDRFYSKHHAKCGISKIYSNENDVNKWRNLHKPSKILSKLCEKYKVDCVTDSKNDEIILGPNDYFDIKSVRNSKNEKLSLLALQEWHRVPQVGFHLVPEHIEKRSLYHPLKDTKRQGEIEMWVDIFPTQSKEKTPKVDISPRPPVEYQLRVIIWGARDVLLVDNLFGTKYSDIYVTCKLANHKEKTDVHYGSLTGTAEFNWRMLFEIHYLQIEKEIITHKKTATRTKRKKITKAKCHLVLGIWDKDFISFDDPIGSLTLDLHNMPVPARSSEECDLNNTASLNLFESTKTEGWWAFRNVTKNNYEPHTVAGKVNAQLWLLSLADAVKHPVGRGHSEPDALPKPHREKSVYGKFIRPFRSFRDFLFHINFRSLLRKLLIMILVIMIAVTLISAVFIGIKRNIISRITGTHKAFHNQNSEKL